MNNLLCIGDSWASAHESDTDAQYAGWPEILGVLPALRQARAGSTAAQWAADFEDRLSWAKATDTGAVLISIGGNDIGDMRSFADASRAIFNIRKVVGSFTDRLAIVMLYANPFPGNAEAETAVFCLNRAIHYACKSMSVVYLETSKILLPEHFLQLHERDIHPTRAGWALVAEAIRSILEEKGIPT